MPIEGEINLVTPQSLLREAQPRKMWFSIWKLGWPRSLPEDTGVPYNGEKGSIDCFWLPQDQCLVSGDKMEEDWAFFRLVSSKKHTYQSPETYILSP